MRHASFWSMVALRIILIALIIVFLARREWNIAAMYMPIFLVTLPLVWLGWKDEEYAWLDAGIMTIFILALLNTLFLSWPDYHTLYSYDKAFHAAGGAWVAALAAVVLRSHIRHRVALFACVIAFAVAVGAFWEVFEWVLALLPEPFAVPNTGLADAMADILADTAGALLLSAGLALRRYI